MGYFRMWEDEQVEAFQYELTALLSFCGAFLTRLDHPRFVWPLQKARFLPALETLLTTRRTPIAGGLSLSPLLQALDYKDLEFNDTAVVENGRTAGIDI